MLNQIRTSEAVTTEGPVGLLLGCHERIRHFTGMAMRLAENPDSPPEEICRAAEAVLRYFAVSLPLHEADENDSIFPRLHRALPAGDVVRKAAETMVSQHQAINELLQTIVPLWQAAQSQPVELRDLAPELKQLTNRLRLHFAAHLAMEEDVIFPMVEKLPAEQRRQIEIEMKARRA